MNRIEEKFRELKEKKKKALIVFLTVGYPDLSTTEKLVYNLEDYGVDLIELGVPFSDPIADGPTIQYSSFIALKQGISLKKILEFVKRIHSRTALPLILMSYYNPIYQFPAFFENAKKAGVDGVIIPDLPPEEGRCISLRTKKLGLDLVYLLAPTSNDERIKLISQKSQGFVYVVSLTGVTGIREKLPQGLESFLKKVKNHADKPLALGFGISRAEQIRPVKRFVDGIIVGSAIIEIIRKTKNPFPQIRNFVSELNKVLQ